MTSRAAICAECQCAGIHGWFTERFSGILERGMLDGSVPLHVLYRVTGVWAVLGDGSWSPSSMVAAVSLCHAVAEMLSLCSGYHVPFWDTIFRVIV